VQILRRLPKFLISWIGVNGKLFAKGQDILYQYLIKARFEEEKVYDGSTGSPQVGTKVYKEKMSYNGRYQIQIIHF
jgi:hypothetical protein